MWWIIDILFSFRGKKIDRASHQKLMSRRTPCSLGWKETNYQTNITLICISVSIYDLLKNLPMYWCNIDWPVVLRIFLPSFVDGNSTLMCCRDSLPSLFYAFFKLNLKCCTALWSNMWSVNQNIIIILDLYFYRYYDAVLQYCCGINMHLIWPFIIFPGRSQTLLLQPCFSVLVALGEN